MSFLSLNYKASGLQRKRFLWPHLLNAMKGSLLSFKKLMLVILVLFASSYIFISQEKNPFNTYLKSFSWDFSLPLLELMNRPFISLKTQYTKLKNFGQIQQQLERLERENFKLEEWKALALQLRRENKHLHELLQTLPSEPHPYRTVKVLGTPEGSQFSSLFVSATKSDNIEKDSAVLCAKGVVGRVMESSLFVTRISLLTDANSRTPIRFTKSGEQAILAGTGTKEMIVTHRKQSLNFKESSKLVKKLISVGDTLVTSGFGGVYPPDLPVAIVTRIEEKNNVEIIYAETIASPTSLNFVRILDPLYVSNSQS